MRGALAKAELGVPAFVPQRAANGGGAGAQNVAQFQGCAAPRLAIAVFGAPFVGKSNFIAKFCAQKCGAYASLQMETAAAGQFKSFCSSRVTVCMELGGNMLTTELTLVEIPDPMTSSVEANIQRLWDGFAGCIILADLTRKDCADHARQFVNVWYRKARDDMLQNVVVAGTKADVNHSAFVRNSANVMKIADDFKTLYTPTSAVTGNGIDLAVKLLCDKISSSQTALKTAYGLLMSPELQSILY